MEHYLNISKAAKLAGVSRRQMQREIKAGHLKVFEGDVSVDSLQDFYPDIQLTHQRELDRVERIQQQAVFKIHSDSIPSERVMADQINKLQTRLFQAEAKISEYDDLLMESYARLEDMQKHCDRQQKQALAAFLGWMMSRYNQYHR